MRTLVMCCMRNEGPWLLEWVAHHQALGFSAIWICSNDLSDGSDALLDRLAARGDIRHVRSTARSDQAPQIHGYAQMRRLPEFRSFDWVLVVDADEFLVLPPEVTLEGFLAVREGQPAIAINWVLFGCGGQLQRRPGPVAERFTDCTRRGAADHYKCFVKPALLKSMRIHHPLLIPGAGELHHGNGTPLAKPNGRSPFIDHGPAQLNHYVAKSVEEMCVKVLRGRGAARGLRPDHFIGLFAATGGETDRAIARYRPQVAVRLAVLEADPEVAAALAEVERRYAEQVRSPAARTLFLHAMEQFGAAHGIAGAIERCADGRLHGWACTTDLRQLDLCLIVVDGAPVAETAPCLPRAAAKGTASGPPVAGDCGFSVDLPAGLIDGLHHLVEVQAVHEGKHLGRCARRLRLGAASPEAEKPHRHGLLVRAWRAVFRVRG